MRSMRRFLVLAGAILALSAGASTATASSTPHPVHMTKDCSSYNGVAPTYCVIRESDLAVVPKGTKVWYTGPVLTNTSFLSSNVLLDPENGSTATGYCIFETRTSTGLCTFWKGTGVLTGFTAVIDVSIDASGLWKFDGTYYFANVDDVAPEVAPSTEDVSTFILVSQDERPR